MNYITTPDQFIGEISVSTNSCNSEKLQYYIEQHEPTILLHILGGKFYHLLQEESGSSLTGDWDILVNGGLYSYEDYELPFKGLKVITAKLIYFYIQRDLAIQATANGGIKIKTEAGLVDTTEGKAVYNWNDAVNIIGLPRCGKNTTEGSLYHFIQNSEFKEYCLKSYGLCWL